MITTVSQRNRLTYEHAFDATQDRSSIDQRYRVSAISVGSPVRVSGGSGSTKMDTDL